MSQQPPNPQSPGQFPLGQSAPPPAPYGHQTPPADQPGPYGTPNGGYPQGGFPPTPPAQKKKPVYKRWWFWVAIVVFAIIVGSCAGAGGSGTESDSDSGSAQPADEAAQEAGADEEPAPEAEEAVEQAGVGDTVSAGDFEVSVTEVEAGVSRVGDEFLNEEPQGQFVLVSMTITNTGDSAVMFTSSDVTLLDAEGRQHSADGAASMYIEDSNAFLEEINPGNTVEGIIAFDIPEGIEPQVLEFSGGLFSSPVEIALS
ncbi:DUF4352 domain-containing protein [Brevibacterium daeguense]|uniref:DUF4352 domain-containing protein n=1 Tax=Brevibacterium daeguense TaxID=909936 RepID=A0ABP8EJA8_9MICO|nr:DUF4352 domain-containing protein [Brevibacterium daeguense]